MMLRTSLLFLGSCMMTLAGQPYCDAPPEVQAELRKSAALWDRPGPKKAMDDERKAILSGLVERLPDDIQANRRFQNDSGLTKADLEKRYKALLDSAPDRPLLMYFYAQTLIGRNTPEAIRLLEDALRKDPDLAWAHMALGNIYSWGKFKDPAKAKRRVDAFFSLCSAVSDSYPLRMLGSFGSPELQRKVAAALRERLALAKDREQMGAYESLWNLEFKTISPNEHEDLRKRIVADVARLREVFTTPTQANLRTMRQGYEQAGDKAGVTAIEDQLLRLLPESQDAARITMERWNKEHPYPKPSDPEEKKLQYARLKYPVAGKWVEQWPWDPSPRADRFHAAKDLKDLPPGEMKKAGEQLISFLRDNPVMWATPPFAHQVAEEYVRRGIFPEDVPDLVKDGIEEVRKREVDREASDMDTDEIAKYSRRAMQLTELSGIELLAQAYLKVRQSDRAAEVRARLDALTAQEDDQKISKMRVASRVAELEGRKMDAFAYLEKSLEMTPKPTNDYAKLRQEELRAELSRLWKDLGGSDEAWKVRTEQKPEVQEAKSGGGWKPPEKVIPAFDLPDMSGKRWKTHQFAGKTLLVNIWATWCGPCRTEHPHLQKLYEKVKDRKDVAIVTFNVDEQVGMVQPYMEENKFTFPVLFAGSFINEVFNGISIPRNWLLDHNGVHRLEQIGFGESADWEARFLAEIEKLATGQH